MTPTELMELRIADVITDREYDAALLQAKGLSQRAIALALNLSRSSVRERLQNAERKIQAYRKDAA